MYHRGISNFVGCQASGLLQCSPTVWSPGNHDGGNDFSNDAYVFLFLLHSTISEFTGVVSMLIVALFGFGVARESITFPTEKWNWLLVRNVFYKPYFMVYGEVYAHEIDTCLDKIWEEHLNDGISIAQHLRNTSDIPGCVPGYWIPSVLLALFMVVTFLLLTNVFIAVFNGIFAHEYLIAKHLWLFTRYHKVMEFETTPVTPPPLTFIYYGYVSLKFAYYWMMTKCFKRKNVRKPLIDFSLSKYFFKLMGFRIR